MIVPKEVRYITFTRLKEDVKQEIINSLFIKDISTSVDRILFDDLSEHYFDGSMVPDDWYCKGDMITRLQKRSGHESIFVQIAHVINAAQPDSLVVLDSVTEIATQCNTPALWNNLTGFFHGLQRVAKQKNLTMYLLLSWHPRFLRETGTGRYCGCSTAFQMGREPGCTAATGHVF